MIHFVSRSSPRRKRDLTTLWCSHKYDDEAIEALEDHSSQKEDEESSFCYDQTEHRVDEELLDNASDLVGRLCSNNYSNQKIQ